MISQETLRLRHPPKQGKVKVPDDWSRIGDNIYLSNAINNKTIENATELLDKIKMPEGKEKPSVQDIIKYNPSVFNSDGTFKTPLQLTKLDLPTGATLALG